jgi:hypothetical protein
MGRFKPKIEIRIDRGRAGQVSVSLWHEWRHVRFSPEVEPECYLTVASSAYRDKPGFQLPDHPCAPPVPYRTTPVAAEVARSLLEKISNASVPIAPPHVNGLDGTNFELEIDAGFNHACYHWWCGVPDCWKPIGEIAAEMLKLADLPEWREHSEPYLLSKSNPDNQQ